MAGRFPDNTILSHDLIDRVLLQPLGFLVSDVELYEEYPSRYNADMKRRHRWIRGDWQILQWLLPQVPSADARRLPNPLSVLSQWKILDNLRRSLVPLALLLLLVGTWALAPQMKGAGLVLVLVIVSAPMLLSSGVDAVRKPRELPWSLHLEGMAGSFLRQSGQILLTVAFLPYEAFVSTDAIVRTLLRVFVVRKRLLEWVSAGEEARSGGLSIVGFIRAMWIVPLLGLGAGGFSLSGAHTN